MASNCRLHGSLPSFAHLPDLTEINLGSNQLDGDLPDDFLFDTPLLGRLDLSFKSVHAWQ